MQLRGTLTLLWIFLLVPVTVLGAYFAYNQARLRVSQLNQITPLGETDLGHALRLVLGLEDPAQIENIATPPPEAAITLTALPLVMVGGTPIAIPTIAPAETALPNVQPTAASVDPRRVTVLLMGIDQREGEKGQFRTDTMIVLSIDPVAKTGAMLSIPRDLWVSIPGGFGESRINTANFIGDNPDVAYPGGGPALAMLTVEKVIGVPIDHYILINFDAFVTLINAIGPIQICVKELINDPKYPDGSYGYMPIRIEPGCQDMPADRLLQYARTRATPGSDFDRAARQQEVIMAVRDKILTTGGVKALLSQAATLWDSLSNNIRTDMTLDEMIQLGLTAQGITDIRKGSISTGEVLNGTASDGSEILIPIQTDILKLVADLFHPPDAPVVPSATIAPSSDLPLAVRQEGAIIALLNGTSIKGRAGNLQKYLLGFNLDVGFIGNHSSADVTTSTIIYYGNHAETATYLAQILANLNDGIAPPVQVGEGTRTEGNVLVIIGTDLRIPEPPAQ